jgi:ABC-type antimicrobial peptide transport system permease subunit
MTAKSVAYAFAVIAGVVMAGVAFGFLIGITKVGLHALLDRFLSGPVALALVAIFVIAILWQRWSSWRNTRE